MEERFPYEFVTWNHKTMVGVKVSDVFGMDSKTGKVWTELARQIYCEQGPEYKVIEHFDNGAPFLENYPGRISLSHTDHLFVVAMLPKTPEVSLEHFNTRTAMGIDAESLERTQVIRIRDKFLSSEEQIKIPDKDLNANILDWTAKEALYKSALCEGLDFKNSITILSLPELLSDPVKGSEKSLGKALLKIPTENGYDNIEMNLFSYRSYGCCVTIAFSPKCAKFGQKLNLNDEMK